MWGRLATKLAVFLLHNSTLTNENRQLLTTVLLDRLGALPLRAKVVIDDVNRIFIDGKPLTLESAKLMYNGSQSLLKNFARNVVREQVTYMAIQKGVHENTSPEQGLFAKAALWFIQEEDLLYSRFAQVEAEEGSQ